MHLQNKNHQRKQVMRKLITATEQIIDSEALTRSRFESSAAIRHEQCFDLYYFDDLNHLIYYTLIRYLKDYNSALAENVKPEDDPRQQIIQVFEVFCHYAFQTNPYVYYTLFFSKYSRHLSEIQWGYYDIFQLDLPLHGNSTIDKMIRSESVFSRNAVLLEELVTSGEFSGEQAKIINNTILYVQQSLLYNKLVGVNRDTVQESTRELMSIIRYLLGMQ